MINKDLKPFYSDLLTAKISSGGEFIQVALPGSAKDSVQSLITQREMWQLAQWIVENL